MKRTDDNLITLALRRHVRKAPVRHCKSIRYEKLSKNDDEPAGWIKLVETGEFECIFREVQGDIREL